MRRCRVFLPLFLTVALLCGHAETRKPKLIVSIVVDQFRYDYLTRFRPAYNAGLQTLLTKGAVFTNAQYIHFPTVTAVGHSTVLSGATPAMSGIIANEWWDRDSPESDKQVSSVSDSSEKLLGAPGQSSSPKRLLVSTLGDEMHAVVPQSLVVSISLKDRAAILPGGHSANGAYWFDNKSGGFVSSSYYFPDLPSWAKDFNQSHPADKYAGVEWMGKKFAAPGEELNASLAASPWGNELIEAFVERAVTSEKIGQRGVTDLLAVSFSSNDYVGHAMGPDDPQVKDMAIRTDMLLGKLFSFLNQKVGMSDVLVVFTADHGVAPLPEENEKRKMPGGRYPNGVVEKAVQATLEKEFGAGKWVTRSIEGGNMIYLNLALIQEKKLSRAAVTDAAAGAARAIPHIFRVYTREQIMNNRVDNDAVGMRVKNGFYPARGADLVTIQEPYWLFGAKGTSHGTPFDYDTHVPVIFMGPGIKPGKYYGTIAVNDIAPTLATMMEVEIPSGSVGRVLAEIFNKDVN
jgi:predicted AlkP superfamily pyrophosphatase or phosphodiesterase